MICLSLIRNTLRSENETCGVAILNGPRVSAPPLPQPNHIYGAPSTD